MGVIGASGLIYRDFLQYILPTIVGISLFAPLLAKPGTSLDIENLILLAFVLGYLIFTPAASLAKMVQSWLSPHREKLRQVQAARKWWGNNWDYDQLWAALDKDEREYLYATASYIHFFRITALYLVIYTLANVVLIVRGLGVPAMASDLWISLTRILDVQTPMLGNWHAPTWIVTLGALVLCAYQFINALEEFDILFSADGFYVKFSEKHQRKIGGIAAGVWGWLQRQDDTTPIAGVAVCLLNETGTLIARETSGPEGQFQFIGVFEECLGQTCSVHVDHPGWAGQLEFKLVEKSVPGVRLLANRNQAKVN